MSFLQNKGIFKRSKYRLHEKIAVDA